MRNVKKIFVVFKTHFDYGYTALAQEILHKYATEMLSDIIKVCTATENERKGHRFVWTMPAYPLHAILHSKEADQADVERAKALIANGQLTWIAAPFTTHTEFCGLEEFVRGFDFSQQLSKEFGYWPISAKMTDVPGHTRMLPSILAKAGVRFLHLGCNPGCKPPDVPRLFFWEGPDGNKTLTFYNKGYYGSALTPPEDWDFPVWLALMQTNDNVGPQGPAIVQNILDEVAREMPGTEVEIGTLDDFYRALSQCSLENVPVVPKDLADTWIHGVGTYPNEVGGIRALRPALADTEKALSVGLMHRLFSSEAERAYRESVAQAYESSLLFGEHTWGMAGITNLGQDRRYKKEEFQADKAKPGYQRAERSWEEQRDRYRLAQAQVDRCAPEIMDTLAASVAVDGPRLVVFNGLGWTRDAEVSLDRTRDLLRGKALKDLSTGEEIAVYSFKGGLRARVKDVPALGYKTLGIVDAQAPTGVPQQPSRFHVDTHKGILENEWYRIELDPAQGVVTSILGKDSGLQWVDPNKPFGFGQYRYDIYSPEDETEYIRAYAYRFFGWLIDDLARASYPAQEHLTFRPTDFCIQSEIVEGFAASIVLKARIADESVQKFGNAHELTTRITVYADNDAIDFDFALGRKEETPFVEAGHFAFPLNIAHPDVRINKLGAVIDPATEIAKDANTELYCCENWVDLSSDEVGMTVIPFDTPLFSLGDQKILKFKSEYQPEEPVLYFNAFNNQWGTNFPFWMGGDYAFRYRLIPHAGRCAIDAAQRRALDSLHPCLIGIGDGKAGAPTVLPLQLSFLHSEQGMRITALKPLGEGSFILRLVDIVGEGRTVRLQLCEKARAVFACDLFDRPGQALAQDTDTFSFQTAPFELHSFCVKA